MTAKRYSVEQINEIVQSLGDMGLMVSQKNDPASTTLTAPALHGPLQGNAAQFGLFSAPGVRPEMLATLVRPRSLSQLLTPNPSRFTNEDLEVMTGQTLGSGTNATGFTGNPPGVGQLKKAKIRFAFGSYYVKTDLEAIPLIGQLRDRADVPRNILNSGPTGSPLIPDIMFQLRDTQSAIAHELFRIGVDLQRTLETVYIIGDDSKASGDTQLGHFVEFDGFDQFVKTGWTDVGGTLVPSLDSAVLSFNVDVGATIAGGDGRDIVEAITDIVWGLKDRATEMGMDGVVWAIVMRKEAFRSIVEKWALSYNTVRVTSTNAGQPIVEMGNDVSGLRLEMMNGQYLLVDGIPVPVVFSEGIPQDILANNQFKSDVYVMPISWQGMPLLRLDYFPMNNQYATEFANFAGDDIGILNNGMYIVGYRSTGLAKEYHFGARFRLILETPWLAGRVDDVAYVFRAPIRNAFPGDTHFSADGGVTYNT